MVGNDAWRGDGGVKSKRSIGKLSLETQLFIQVAARHWRRVTLENSKREVLGPLGMLTAS